MSFILSWSGYFSRKGWDPMLWAKANNIDSYEACVKRICKMQVKPPTESQFDELFMGRTAEVLRVEAEEERVRVEASKPEVAIKALKPEPPPKTRPKVAAKPTPKENPVKKPASPTKKTPRKRTRKSAPESQTPAAGSGTSSIIESVKKKPAAKRSRSRKNVKST